MRLGVRDAHHIGSYHRTNTKAFTWTNAHQDNTMIQTRIDRIYINQLLEQQGGATEIYQLFRTSRTTQECAYTQAEKGIENTSTKFNRGRFKFQKAKLLYYRLGKK